MNKMRIRDPRRFSARAMFMHDSMACFDRFFHYVPTSNRQRPYAATGQIPQPFVVIAGVKKNDALAGRCVVKRGTLIFGDQRKERLPPRSIGFIKDFFAKFLEFFNADDSARFRDGFAPLVIDGFSVLEFFKWHRTLYLVDSSESELNGLYSTQ